MKIVVLTSNAYRTCLTPFAHYWNQFSGEVVPVTIAGYDPPLDPLPDNFSFTSIGNQADYTWSGGLLRYLTMINDPHILLLLEDYFLVDRIDWLRVRELAWWLSTSERIGKIDLTGDRMKTPYTRLGHDLVQSSLGAPFQMSVQAALWNVAFLKSWLRPNESPWEFEKHASSRYNDLWKRRGVSDLVLGTEQPALGYINAVGGEGNFPGKLSTKYMPDWMRDECEAEGWLNG